MEKTPKVVGTVASQYDVVADGLADMSLMVASYAPGRFPLIEGMELPFFGDNEARRSPAIWATYEKYVAPKNVFPEVVPLSIFRPVRSTSSPPARNWPRSRTTRAPRSAPPAVADPDHRAAGRHPGDKAGVRGL